MTRLTELFSSIHRRVDRYSVRAIGQLAFNAEPSPVVLTINYALRNGHIVFRTAAGSKQEAAKRGQAATFQVDCVRSERRSAWSIMVRGHLEAVVDESECEATPEPLPSGERIYCVRLHIENMTGRRIPPEHGWTAPSRVWRGMEASDLMG